MSFADALIRLRDAAQDPPSHRQRGRGRLRVVEVEDLQQLLFHFDRLDEEIRRKANDDNQKEKT